MKLSKKTLSYDIYLRVSSLVKEKFLSTPSSVRGTANLGGDRTNAGIKILPPPSANGLLGGRMSG